MRGSTKWQVNTVFNTIKNIGESRHEAKQEAKAITQSNNPHDIAKEVQNISYNTLQTYTAAITKLETALERYNGNTYDLSEKAHSVLEQARKDGLKEPEQHRAFQNPQLVIDNIKNQDYRTIAAFQLASGLRISELNHIRPDQLFTKDNKNFVSVEQGKGGKDRTVEVRNTQAFQAFKQLVESKQQQEGKYAGKFIFSKSSYTHAVTNAAKATGEHATGSHAFRWTYAQQELLHKIVIENKTESEAKEKLSGDLGHNRPQITNHYLR